MIFAINTTLACFIITIIGSLFSAHAGESFAIAPGKWVEFQNYSLLPINKSKRMIRNIKLEEFRRLKYFSGGFAIQFEVSISAGKNIKPDEITIVFYPSSSKHKHDPYIFINPFRQDIPVAGKPVKKDGKYVIGWFRRFSPSTPILPFKSTFHIRAILPDGTITEPSKNYTISINETDHCYNHALTLGTPLYKLDAFKGTQLRQSLYQTCKQIGINALTKALARKCHINQILEKYRLKWLYSYPECKK